MLIIFINKNNFYVTGYQKCIYIDKPKKTVQNICYTYTYRAPKQHNPRKSIMYASALYEVTKTNK